MRYFIYLSYDGTNYHGWQIQPNANSVQETLNKALSTILRTEVTATGAGRTDTGVHARLMVAHFDLTLADNEDARRKGVMIKERLNSLLPWDIAIHKVVPVKEDANSRFDATSRTYKYYVCKEKDPFNGRYACRIRAELDYPLMNRACELLFQYTDFTSFSKLHTDVKTNNCTIMQAAWQQQDANTWVFTIKANRFLRNMVRAIVGTLVDVGLHKTDLDGFRRIIEGKDRCIAGQSMPGNALFLTDIEYPDNLFI